MEEELPGAPSVSSSAEYGYTTVSVERGDLVREVSATVEYQPSTEEKLYFALDGERIERLYVAKGDTVKKGDTLCIIEAMKLLNEIEAEEDGVIKEVLVENGQPVEFGQPLFILG